MSYENEYPQFVDTSEPLSLLEESDFKVYKDCQMSFDYLSDLENEEYFTISYGDDTLQSLDIYHLRTNDNNLLRPVLFFIHGGGWVSEDKSSCRFSGAKEWVKNGYTVVSINYRLAPHVIHPSQVDDCAKALKWVIDNISEFGGNPTQICIIGHSSGAHLAALLVADKRLHEKFNIDIGKVKCWIPVSGVHDLSLHENYLSPIIDKAIPTMLGDADANDCSPISHITGNEPPCLIIHGGDDWLVPITNSIKLYEKLIEKDSKEVTFIKVPGYWHFNMLLGYQKKGHKPAEIINKYLAEKLPVSDNK